MVASAAHTLCALTAWGSLLLFSVPLYAVSLAASASAKRSSDVLAGLGAAADGGGAEGAGSPSMRVRALRPFVGVGLAPWLDTCAWGCILGGGWWRVTNRNGISVGPPVASVLTRCAAGEPQVTAGQRTALKNLGVFMRCALRGRLLFSPTMRRVVVLPHRNLVLLYSSVPVLMPRSRHIPQLSFSDDSAEAVSRATRALPHQPVVNPPSVDRPSPGLLPQSTSNGEQQKKKGRKGMATRPRRTSAAPQRGRGGLVVAPTEFICASARASESPTDDGGCRSGAASESH